MMPALPLEKLVPDYIKRFEAYIPSKPDDELKKMYCCSKLYRLNNNENPLGPPETARRAIEEFPRRRHPSIQAGMPITCGTSWRISSGCTRTSFWWETGPTR